MRAIRFTDPRTREEGLRIIILNGLVVFTGKRGVYRIPNYVEKLLKAEDIPFEVVKEGEEAEDHDGH